VIILIILIILAFADSVSAVRKNFGRIRLRATSSKNDKYLQL